MLRSTLVDEAGFSLIEMLVSTAIMLTVMASVFALMNPAQGIYRAQPEASDMQQRLRVAADTLAGDLRMAGAGVHVGAATGPLVDYFAPILPYRVGELSNDPSLGVRFRRDAISTISAGAATAQSVVSDAVPIDSRSLWIAPSPSCRPAAASVCGFEAGARAILFDANGAYDVTTVTAVAGSQIQIQHAGTLSQAYMAGASIAQVDTQTYYLKTGTSQLMRYDGYRSDLPLVDHVVKLDFQYFGDPQPPRLLAGKSLTDSTGPYTTYGPRPPAIDFDTPSDTWPAGENCVFSVQDGAHTPRLPVLGTVGDVPLAQQRFTDGPWCPDDGHVSRFDADLLRIRRVLVTVRVEAALAMFRGPAGMLFLKGGTATSAERYLPDLEITFDVSPRNMNVRR
jgi:prepilin-type N-terminal cleavage/methylation domain-containing protein